MWVGQQLADGLDFWGFLGSLILGGIILGIYTGLLGYVGMTAVGHLIKIIFHIYSPLLSQFSIIYSRMVAYLRVFKPKIKKGE